MSEKALKRIEKALVGIREDLAELCARVDALASRDPASAPAPAELLAFLDQFRAAEALGEASLGAWIDTCTTDCLRGGLRTVQMREGSHARLLEQRMKELGGSPEHEVPEQVQRAVMESVASRDKSDLEKLGELVTQLGDPGRALQPIFEMADRLEGDPETQSLLRTIAQDERSTLDWLCESHALLSGETQPSAAA
ncbi:MAG: hypothetical protein ACE5IL_04905 [Myxococcota bacterium]